MVSITYNEESDNYLMIINGEVDASSSIHLDNALGEAVKSNKNILVDCTDLKYISSAGLGVFMSYIQEIKELDIKLVLYGLSDKVKNVFQILGLDQLLTMEETLEDAKKRLNAI